MSELNWIAVGLVVTLIVLLAILIRQRREKSRLRHRLGVQRALSVAWENSAWITLEQAEAICRGALATTAFAPSEELRKKMLKAYQQDS